jgi:hypothetical protein
MGKQDVVSDAAPVEEVAAEPSNALGYHLVVRHAFGTYRKGYAIYDEKEMAAVMAGDNAHSVHRVVG